MTELPGQTITLGGLEIHDPEEVYQFRPQLDQSFYAQGRISEIVAEAFRLGYERAKEDYRVDEFAALLSLIRTEQQKAIADGTEYGHALAFRYGLLLEGKEHG